MLWGEVEDRIVQAGMGAHVRVDPLDQDLEKISKQDRPSVSLSHFTDAYVNTCSACLGVCMRSSQETKGSAKHPHNEGTSTESSFSLILYSQRETHLL